MSTEFPVNREDLLGRLTRQLHAEAPAAHALFNTLCHLADRRQTDLYVVGGVVRDLLLDRRLGGENLLDLDLAIDGDPAEFHSTLSEAADKQVTIHDRFGTANAILADGTNIDLARTRNERYPSPAALPIVSPAPIDVDLHRRDFSINAAALAVSGNCAGRLIDPHGAASDLKRREVRTLHASSFRDDPTRLIRAARYTARIGGTIERRTMADARRDREHLKALSPARFGDAWRLLLQESNAVRGLEFARRLRIPQAREPKWVIPKRALQSSGDPERFWASTGLLSHEPQIAEWLPESVGMNRRERTALEAGVRLRAARRSIGQTRRASSVALRLKQFPNSALEVAQTIWSGPSQLAISNFLERRERIASPITAERLLELGIEQGPKIGDWLEQIESAIWDGELDPSDASSVARMEQRIRLSR